MMSKPEIVESRCDSLDDSEAKIFDDDVSPDNLSQLSFIVKEKLHAFATGIRRRKSELIEHITRESSSDDESIIAYGKTDNSEMRPTLLSLIGLESQSLISSDSKSFRPFDSINPQGQFYLIWLSIVAVTFLYNAFGIPLRSTYPYQTESNLLYWLIFDYASDVIYIIDMVFIKTRIQFIHAGIAVKDRKKMVKNYLKSGEFKFDLISILPLDIMYLYTGPVAAWRFVRIFKFHSFAHFFSLLDHSFSKPYIIRITKTLCYIIFIIHCNSCVYYMLSAWQAFGQIAYRINDRWHLNKWVYNNQGNAYIRCFYFTTAVATSTGNNPAPTNVIEFIYMTFSWMMGVFVFALLLGQIRDIVSNANKNKEVFRQAMDRVMSECKRSQLPKEVVDRVMDWFYYTWQNQRTLDEKKLIERLPLKLQTDLALSVHYNTLSKVQIFQDCDRAILRDLVLRFRPITFLPGDMICRKGDVGKEMYIVNDGILEVVGGDHNEKVFAELTEGSVFGEISLLSIGGNNRRTANIRSKGYSTLFVLSKEDLNDVIKDYPETQQLLRRKAKKMLNKDAKVKAEDALTQVKGMEKICHVSTHIPSPKMFETVLQILPECGSTKKMMQIISTDNMVAK